MDRDSFASRSDTSKVFHVFVALKATVGDARVAIDLGFCRFLMDAKPEVICGNPKMAQGGCSGTERNIVPFVVTLNRIAGLGFAVRVVTSEYPL